MIDGNRALWLHVLQQAFMDATSESVAAARDGAVAGRGSLDQRTADRWIRDCGWDFRMVCTLAGMDADFLSGAYRAGRVNGVWLRQDPKIAGLSEAEKRQARAWEAARRRGAERRTRGVA